MGMGRLETERVGDYPISDAKAADPLALQLVCRHEDFLLVAKPPGLSFHREGGEPGLLERARGQWGEPVLHAVHRLDRITSGLVLLARHGAAARDLGALLARGMVEKYYLALSHRKPGKSQGLVRGAMVKGRGGNWRLAPAGGPLALTQFFSQGVAPGLRLFVLRPRTGRTHQLRVALKSLGSPILGDARYGGAQADRGYLHAWALRFSWRGEMFSTLLPPAPGEHFEAGPLPARLHALDAPWALPWPRLNHAGADAFPTLDED